MLSASARDAEIATPASASKGNAARRKALTTPPRRSNNRAINTARRRKLVGTSSTLLDFSQGGNRDSPMSGVTTLWLMPCTSARRVSGPW